MRNCVAVEARSPRTCGTPEISQDSAIISFGDCDYSAPAAAATAMLPLWQRFARFIYAIVKSRASKPSYWAINLKFFGLLRRLPRYNSRRWNRNCRHRPNRGLLDPHAFQRLT